MTIGGEFESIGFVEQTKRERLTDEGIGNLISAGGNHVAKAITLMLMADGNIYSRNDLHRTLLFHQDKQIGWRMDSNLPFSYCAKSLAPIGLVAKEVINPDLSTYGYQITDYGKMVGIPFYGLMLDWSEKHRISLPQLWGRTSSPSPRTQTSRTTTGEEMEFLKRAPATTLKILSTLVTAPDLPIREIDLATRIKERADCVEDHLNRLARAGLIGYQSVEADKPYSYYELSLPQPEGNVPIYQSRKTLTQAVLAVYQQHPGVYLASGDVENFLPLVIKTNSAFQSRRISNILGFLKSNRWLKVKQFHNDYKSEIYLLDNQRRILTELLEIIGRFQSQDVAIVAMGESLAKSIINDPTKVSAILRRAKEDSSAAKASSIEETLGSIYSLISIHPGIINKEISTLLASKNKKLSHKSIDGLTRLLVKKYPVKVIVQGKVKRFFPSDTPAQPK